jgi:hypothetical protein
MPDAGGRDKGKVTVLRQKSARIGAICGRKSSCWFFVENPCDPLRPPRLTSSCRFPEDGFLLLDQVEDELRRNDKVGIGVNPCRVIFSVVSVFSVATLPGFPPIRLRSGQALRGNDMGGP